MFVNAAGYKTCGVMLLLTGLGALIAFQQMAIQDLRSELRQSAEKLAAINEFPDSKQIPAMQPDPLHQEELERLRLENKDLLRLRNEMHQLRDRLLEKELAADKLRDEFSAWTNRLNVRIWDAATGTSIITPPSLSIPAIPRNSYIGVVFSGSFTNSQPQGVAINSIAPDSPAAEAQLQTGDLILGIDGNPVSSVEQIVRTVASHNPGDRLVFAFLRDGVLTQVAVITRPPPGSWTRP